MFNIQILCLYFFFLPLLLSADSYLSNNHNTVILSKDKNSTNSTIHITIKNMTNKDIYIAQKDIDSNRNIFDVKFNNKEIPYIGRIIKRKINNNINYITLQPKEIYVFKVTLEKYYKMTTKGQYSVQYKGNRQILTKEKFKTSQLFMDTSKALDFIFSPSLSKKFHKTMQKIGNYNQCSQAEIDTIDEAYQKALLISENTSNAINITEEFIKSDRYNTWFGTTTNTDGIIVKTSMNNISNTLKNKNINFDCSCNEPYFAYIISDEPYSIYLCNGFWSAELEGTDSQSGTIVHQLSHFNIVAASQNYSYGTEDTKKLATFYPHYAIYNADSYEYFAENIPYLTMDNIFLSAQSIHITNRLNLQNTLGYSNDKNMFKITIDRSGIYSFFSSGDLDTEGTLYKEHNIILKFNDDSNFDNLNFSFSEYLFNGNTYYLKVNTYENNLGSYTLNIIFNNQLDWLIPITYLIF